MFKHKWNFWLIKEIFIFGWKQAVKSERSELQQGSGCWALRIHPLPILYPHWNSPHPKEQSWTALKQVLYLILSLVLLRQPQHFAHGYFWGGTTARGSVVSTLLRWVPMPKLCPTSGGLEVWPWCAAPAYRLGQDLLGHSSG